ncbi:hypothetical protein Tco_0875206 [Tanacetum coccineum]|uniref:Uncharacterized protein n=1 Tax=Tanacetum coccineum TaxID=301880 RepID=A0ABQ5BNV5_9ASTR
MRTSKYGESNAIASEDLTLQAGNPVKEILLKLNLPDYKLIAVDGWTGRNADIKDGVLVKYIIGEPLSPDRVFDFPEDELEPHPTYDFFAPGPLPGYMIVPAIKEVAEPVAEAEEEQVIAPVVDMEEEQMDAPVIDMEKDLAVLFGDDDFEDDASNRFDEEEVWEVNEEWLMAPTTPPPMLAVPPPNFYEVGGPSTAAAEGPSFPLPAPGLPIPLAMIEDLSTRLGNLEYGHGQLVWVEAKMVSHEVESEKWRRLLLHWMYDAIGVSTDGRKEDFFLRNGV